MGKLRFNKRMRLDRIQSIFKMREQGYGNREIARICKCSASTVSATINGYKHPEEPIWDGMTCYERAKYVWDMQKARARVKKRFRGHIRSREIREYVEEKLIVDEWSPEIISHKILEEVGERVSTNTIYRYVKRNGPRLKKHLYERGKPRKQRVAHRRGRFRRKEPVEKKYINQRPETIDLREEFGDWEADLLIGLKGGSGYVILSLIERKTRQKAFIRLPNAKAATVLAHLTAFFMKLPQEARQSVTMDNGSEFSVFYMHKLETLFPGFKVYYTETYSPQQKGSDEHSNGRFRRAFPKKTDFALVSKADIKREENRLNDRPMKLHGFKTPREMFQTEIQRLLQKLLAA